MDRNSPERALQQTGSFPQACTRPERHGADRGIRLARRCPPRAPCTWLQARGSLHQLHAAPAPPSPQCPCPVPSSVRSWDLRGHLIHTELIHSHLNHLHELP